MTTETAMIRLTDQEFQEFVQFVRTNFGINLEKKRLLIEARLFSILSKKNVSSFTEYLNLVRNNPDELNIMLNRLTTNHTYFMREPRHFEFLKEVMLPDLTKNNRDKCLRIWSAGCSTGEEAYTAVMVMKDWFGPATDWDYRVLATDISTKVLQEALMGVYSPENLQNLPAAWKVKYFQKQDEQTYVLSDEIKKEVIFRKLNLMDSFPFQNPFDLIFCRNVMIYFDQETKNRLVQKFYNSLKPGGYLLIGHSETIQRDTIPFRYIEPSIYQKG
ncbi:MAG: protein-glutamate O-methyltransferase [Oscillospiraceae bacterium]